MFHRGGQKWILYLRIGGDLSPQNWSWRWFSSSNFFIVPSYSTRPKDKKCQKNHKSQLNRSVRNWRIVVMNFLISNTHSSAQGWPTSPLPAILVRLPRKLVHTHSLTLDIEKGYDYDYVSISTLYLTLIYLMNKNININKVNTKISKNDEISINNI